MNTKKKISFLNVRTDTAPLICPWYESLKPIILKQIPQQKSLFYQSLCNWLV